MASPDLLAARVADAVADGNVAHLKRWAKHPRFNPALAEKAWINAVRRSNDAVYWLDQLEEAGLAFKEMNNKRAVVFEAGYYANADALGWLFKKGVRADWVTDGGARLGSVPLLNSGLAAEMPQRTDVLKVIWEHLEEPSLVTLVGCQRRVVVDFFKYAPPSWVEALVTLGWDPDQELPEIGGTAFDLIQDSNGSVDPDALAKLHHAQAFKVAGTLEAKWAKGGAASPKVRF